MNRRVRRDEQTDRREEMKRRIRKEEMNRTISLEQEGQKR